jgi:uncharacterized membrane protein
MLRYRRDVRASFTRLVAMSQAAFFGLLFVCIALHPGYLFARNEGGVSNFGVHAATVVPFTGAFGLCAWLLLLASLAMPRTAPERSRLAIVLAAFAVVLVGVLATTYPYQHGPVLHDVHVATGAAAVCFEAAVAAWLLASFRRDAVDVVAGGVELVGFALAVATVAGALHVLFVSQLLTVGALGVLLVRACADVEARSKCGVVAPVASLGFVRVRHHRPVRRDVMDDEPTTNRGVLRQVYTFHASEQAVHPATRLAGFTDAILAIASTVLVLNLTVHADVAGDGLARQIDHQRAALLSVLLGFVWIIGGWVLSHRSLRQLRGVDHYMTLFVVSSTLSITLIPFAVLLLANGYGHPDFWIGVEAVSSVVLVGTVLSAFGTDYAHRHGLLVASAPSQHRAALMIWYGVLGLVVLAVVLAPFAPWVALTIVVITRLSALLPLASDRVGYGAETSAVDG